MKNNEFNLKEELGKLTDKRRKQGQMHKIENVLIISIMATMSGYMGYRAIGDFAKRYKKELVEYLSIKKDRIPSYSTIRNVFVNIDYKEFEEIFKKWTGFYVKKTKNKWISVDGKAIRGTKQSAEDKKLAHLVSFFISDSKEILIARKTATKSNEIPLVQEMIAEFPLKNMIITMDALHTQSETLKKNNR